MMTGLGFPPCVVETVIGIVMNYGKTDNGELNKKVTSTESRFTALAGLEKLRRPLNTVFDTGKNMTMPLYGCC